MKRLLQLPLAIALALAGTDVLALGLGPVHVNSGLNEPLNAEIPVIVGSAAEAEGLVAQLASGEEFERVGLSRSRISVPLNFAVVKGPRGDLVIKVTSQEAVRQTFIDFLVEANWPKGRVLREYTVLLDPPVTAPVTQPAPSGTPGTVTMIRRAAPPPQPAPPAAEASPARAPSVAAAAPPSREPPVRETPAPATPHTSKLGNYGPVEAGDTLTSIARAQLDGDANLNQMMLALFRKNPEAFFKNNINALKRGAILRIPSAEEARAVASVSAATAQVRAQIEDWRGTRAAPTLVADTGNEATAAPKKNPPQSPAPPSTTAVGSKEHLELVPPKSGHVSNASADRPGAGTDAASGNGARADLTRTREALASLQQESGDLKSRVGELEALKQKNDRLLSLKDSEIADLQRKLKDLQGASAAGANGAAVSPAAASRSTAAGDTQPASVAAAPIPAPTTASSNAAGSEASVSSAPSTTTASPSATTPPPAPSTSSPLAENVPPPAATNAATQPKTSPTPPAKTPMTDWMQQDWFLPAALGAGALVLLLALLGLRGRKPTAKPRTSLADAFGDSPLTPLDAAPKTPTSSAAQDLRRQLQEHPHNAGLYLELLSVHYADRDVAAFETDAADMRAHIDDINGPEWREVQAMGRELAPRNALFESGAIAAGAALPAISAASASDTHTFADDHLHDDTIARNDHPFGIDRAHEGETMRDDLRPFDRQVDALHEAALDRDAPLTFGGAPMAQETVDKFGAVHSDASVDLASGFPSPHDGVRDDTRSVDSTSRAFGLDLDTERDSFLPHVQDVLEPGMPAASRDEHALDVSDEPLAFDTSRDQYDEFAQVGDRAAADEAAIDPAGTDPAFGDDAIATKLDLAKAYLDMGDADGARAMLGEVVAEGSDAQKNEAVRLLAEMR